MKKLFLLIAAGLIVGNAGAQESKSLVFTGQGNLQNNISSYAHPTKNVAAAKHHTRAAKTTGGPYSDWFDYWDENATMTSAGYYFNVAADSNIVDAGNNIFTHGLGMSFDPTDYRYYNYGSLGATGTDATTGDNLGINDPLITNSDAYVCDSFFVLGTYIRNDNTVTDSLIIELFVTDTSSTDGSFLLHFNASADGSLFSSDSAPRFADVWYDNPNNDTWAGITLAQKQRYAIALNAAYIADTDVNGANLNLIALSTPFNVPAGQKIVSFVHFKGATTYPLGTASSAANYYHLFAGDPDGAGTPPMQNPVGTNGSYQCGLAATNQNRFSDTAFAFDGHNMLIPSVAYASATGFDVPQCAFHLTYSSTTGVTNVKTVTTSRAYPNPATSELAIAFGTSVAANVTVTLSNTLGQVVRTQTLTNTVNGNVTFNVANLADGVYFYTINANGERTTNRVVVAH